MNSLPTLEVVEAAYQALVGPAPAGAPTGESGAPATTTPAPAVPAGVPGVRRPDPARQGWHLDVTVLPERVVAAASVADRFGFAMDTVTGVDWMAAGQMEVVYDFFHPRSPMHLVVRARIPREKPEIPTVSGVFPGANWHERETHDFFGIRFVGHPDLTPLLLPEDADYHPLRKDFAGAA